MNRRTFRLPQASPILVLSLLLGWVSLPAQAEERLQDGVQRSLEGPDVVIRAGKTRTVYEYRQNGRLRIVKIVPTIGRPYYLVPADQTRGYGDLDQANMLLPNWVIVEF